MVGSRALWAGYEQVGIQIHRVIVVFAMSVQLEASKSLGLVFIHPGRLWPLITTRLFIYYGEMRLCTARCRIYFYSAGRWRNEPPSGGSRTVWYGAVRGKQRHMEIGVCVMLNRGRFSSFPCPPAKSPSRHQQPRRLDVMMEDPVEYDLVFGCNSTGKVTLDRLWRCPWGETCLLLL